MIDLPSPGALVRERRRPDRLGVWALLLFLASSCATSSGLRTRGGSPFDGESGDAPDIEAVVRIFDSAAQEEVTLGAMLDRLSAKDVVFFGETHLDETTHRLELAVYEGLIARRGNVILALEMFERDVQPALDDYLAGRISEREFLARSRPWSNYPTGYRPLIECARRHGLAVVASNTPAALRRKVAFEGKKAFDALDADERAHFPPELIPHPPEYWDRVARAVRGHMGSFYKQRSPEQLLYSSQSLWDNTMAHSCVEALERNPGALVLHVNGDFHSAYRQGTVYQLARRRNDLDVATLSVAPETDLVQPSRGGTGARRADYLVLASHRASGYSDGFHSVQVSSSLRYRLFVPESASEGNPVPLVVFLSEDGLRAADALGYWKAALGEDAAVACVEAPHLERGKQLRPGGRWFFPETFFSDLGDLQAGVERICSYVRRYFPVSRDRVVLAGEGAGATVVVAVALYSKGLHGRAVAIDPVRTGKMAEMSLPRPGGDDEPGPKPGGLDLTVFTGKDGEEWWREQLADFVSVGCSAEVEALPDDPVSRVRAGEDVVRVAAGLSPRSGGRGEIVSSHSVLLLPDESVLARRWAWTVARTMERKQGVPVSVATRAELERMVQAGDGPRVVKPLAFLGEPLSVDDGADTGPLELHSGYCGEDLVDGKALPIAPGSFGGTTVLYVPAGRREEERAALKRLEEKQPLRKRSPFSSLKVVIADEGPGLRETLSGLAEEGRRNVLVVPATFCASAAFMAELEKEATASSEGLSLSFSPGLGERMDRLVR